MAIAPIPTVSFETVRAVTLGDNLRDGQILEAKVTAMLTETVARLSIDGKALDVATPKPLAPGATMTLKAERENGQLRLVTQGPIRPPETASSNAMPDSILDPLKTLLAKVQAMAVEAVLAQTPETPDAPASTAAAALASLAEEASASQRAPGQGTSPQAQGTQTGGPVQPGATSQPGPAGQTGAAQTGDPTGHATVLQTGAGPSQPGSPGGQASGPQAPQSGTLAGQAAASQTSQPNAAAQPGTASQPPLPAGGQQTAPQPSTPLPLPSASQQAPSQQPAVPGQQTSPQSAPTPQGQPPLPADAAAASIPRDPDSGGRTPNAAPDVRPGVQSAPQNPADLLQPALRETSAGQTAKADGALPSPIPARLQAAAAETDPAQPPASKTAASLGAMQALFSDTAAAEQLAAPDQGQPLRSAAEVRAHAAPTSTSPMDTDVPDTAHLAKTIAESAHEAAHDTRHAAVASQPADIAPAQSAIATATTDTAAAAQPRAERAAVHFAFDIPALFPGNPQPLRLEVTREDEESDTPGQDGKPKTWTVRFAAEAGPLGMIHAAISQTGDQVGVRLWAERPDTAVLFKQSARDLQDGLEASNIKLDALQIAEGRPVEQQPQRSASSPTGGSREEYL